ncbi:MAG TPA: 4Fe-4S binding protein [Clostridiaceae bacterium]|nr:4Fe-4S binding protein [Clostridiaceae bacterium]
MLINTGIATQELIKKLIPSPERRARGPYAMVECFQEIPCNPCSTSCPFGAILPMKDINDIPTIDLDRCTGCGICAGVCPGLAIFIIDESKGDGTATVTIPYEFRPLPEKGETVRAVNRQGNIIGDGVVTRILASKKTKTPLITVQIPAELVYEVRFLNLIDDKSNSEEPSSTYQSVVTDDLSSKVLDTVEIDDTAGTENDEDEIIICRCEGLTLGVIRDLIREGYTTVDEIKRISRAGMGPCQARTCGPLIASEIARMTGQPIAEIQPSAHRPPVKPLPIEFFLGGDSE